MNTSNDQPDAKGFANLINAPGVTRRFVPREGETITITDKDGKELWSFKVPAPIDSRVCISSGRGVENAAPQEASSMSPQQ
jgi:hypothetical protein